MTGAWASTIGRWRVTLTALNLVSPKVKSSEVAFRLAGANNLSTTSGDTVEKKYPPGYEFAFRRVAGTSTRPLLTQLIHSRHDIAINLQLR
jgi:hypothetical protein